MSVISNKHQFVPFVSSPRSKAFEGQRLVKVSYKTTKAGEKKDSVCVSIPPVPRDQIRANIDNFFEYVIGMYESAQDAIIRDAHEAGNIHVDDEDIDITAVISHLEKSSRGGRLSGEVIGVWFDENLSEILELAVAEKQGLSDHKDRWSDSQTRKMEQMLKAYKDSLSALAGYRTLYNNDKCDKLIRALVLCDDDDVIANGLVKRLQDMKLVAAKQEEEFAL